MRIKKRQSVQALILSGLIPSSTVIERKDLHYFNPNAGIPLTKSKIEATGASFANQILDAGETSPLDAMIKLRALRDVINKAILTLESDEMDEAGM